MVMAIGQEDLSRAIRVPHRLDGANARAFHDQLEAAIGSAHKVVVIDMSDLTYISNAGLRVITQAAKQLQAHDGRLVLCAPSDEVRSVLEASNLDRMIDMWPSLDAAVAARG